MNQDETKFSKKTQMTVEEARRIMGDSTPDISDEELEITIGHLEALASETIKSIMNGEQY